MQHIAFAVSISRTAATFSLTWAALYSRDHGRSRCGVSNGAACVIRRHLVRRFNRLALNDQFALTVAVLERE